MKNSKKLLVLLFIFNFSYGVTYVNNTFSGGLSIPVGEGSEDWHPGFNGGLTMMVKPIKYFGIGPDLSYTRWAADLPSSAPDDLRISLHYWRVICAIRGCYPFEDGNIILFGEVGDGVCVGMGRVAYKNSSDTDTEVDNGMIFGGGINIYHFALFFRFNVVFTEYDKTKWFSINIGFFNN